MILRQADQLSDVKPQSSRTPKLNEYEVTLSHSKPFFILATDSMHAAYSALELSTERDNKLINVRLTDEWKEEET
jgi:hypothetical protein